MRAAEGRLLEGTAIEGLFTPRVAGGTLALAVSGGADSLALLVLADRWRRLAPDRRDLLVLTVDHGLRAESAGEARFVGEVAARFGLPFRSLAWHGPYPTSDIEAAAREARYRLLVAAAREAGVQQIATAHHRDDQAETFLLRLARGSGVYGLSGMAATVDLDGMELVRPLLSLSRADLVAVTAAAGLVAVDDPHNADPRFARARMRTLMPRLAEVGLDAATLADTAARLRRAASAIDHYVDRLFAEAAIVDAMGAVRLDVARFAAEPDETRLRALARILRAVGGAAYVPRFDRLAALEAAMAGDEGEASRRTLAGVVIDRRKGRFRFQRETGRDGLLERRVTGSESFLWDGRFRIELDVEGDAITVGALGGEGRRRLGVCIEDALPRAIEALPALRRGDAILAVPGLDMLPARGSGIRVSARSIVEMRLLDGVPGDDRREFPPDS